MLVSRLFGVSDWPIDQQAVFGDYQIKNIPGFLFLLNKVQKICCYPPARMSVSLSTVCCDALFVRAKGYAHMGRAAVTHA